ncbi:MAG: bifunctional diguanylate cyclase/phosphodiesterase [Caulobacteraceae bacterium]
MSAGASAVAIDQRTPASAVHAAPSLSVLVVSPWSGGANELAGFVRKVLPNQNILVCPNATDAVQRADASHQFGRDAGVFIFDYRGKPTKDLTEELRRVRHAHPNSELIIVTAEGDAATFAACLQVSRSPERLTFLLTPLHPDETARTVREVAARYEALAETRHGEIHRHNQVRGLETHITELQARLDIAMHAARHDPLTGILNRAGFVDELSTRLTRSRQKQTVLLIDLDRFKSVNDTLGHDAGDDLVRKICSAMSGVMPGEGVLARLGGDEFGIILEGASEAGIDEFCSLLLRVCNQSRRVLGHEVQVSASIGVAFQNSEQSQVELMRHADLALYAAKREGRNRYRVYDTVIDKAAKHRLSIESGLERAMNTDQFKMAYQPIVRADSGALEGFEALIRWNSPEYGAISPADFVPIAEEMGLILDLGEWIIRQAFKDCRKWGGPYVSVNLSARQFLRQNVGERILQYAADADLPPEKIQIELTETAIIDDVERADNNLKILRSAGVRVALDDFGTGYSSLVYLNQFAIDCIKIDKSFVDNVTTDRQSAVIVASVAKLAESLGMSVVAEGVETEAQRRILIATGCNYLQGFHFGRPMDAALVPEFITTSV